MTARLMTTIALSGLLVLTLATPVASREKKRRRIDINAAPITTDKSVRYDDPIVYVRSPRWVDERGRKRSARWAEFGHPFAVTPHSDLMLLHPDGKEELLVAGGKGAVQDPYVSCG